MIALMEPLMKQEGAYVYKQLFWEAGMIGQQLYLDSEGI